MIIPDCGPPRKRRETEAIAAIEQSRRAAQRKKDKEAQNGKTSGAENNSPVKSSTPAAGSAFKKAGEKTREREAVGAITQSRLASERKDPLYGTLKPVQEASAALGAGLDRLNRYSRDYQATGNEASRRNYNTLRPQVQKLYDDYFQKAGAYTRAAEQYNAILQSSLHRPVDDLEQSAKAAQGKLIDQRLAVADYVDAAGWQYDDPERQHLQADLDDLQDNSDRLESQLTVTKNNIYFRNRAADIQALEAGAEALQSGTASAVPSQGKRRDRLMAEAIADPSAGNVAKLYTTAASQDEILGLFYLSDDEKAVVKAYADAGDYASIGKYIDLKTRDLNARRVEHFQSCLYSYCEAAPADAVLIRTGAALFNLGGWLESGRQALKNAVTGEYEPIDPNTWAFGAAQTRETATESILDDIESPAARQLVQIALSVADTAVMLPLGPASLPMMSANAAGDKAYELAKQGVEPGKVFALATVTAAIEAATEKLPLDKLKGIIKSGKTGLKAAFINGAMQALPEALAEPAAEYAGRIAENAILGSDSEMGRFVQAQIASGKSREEAERLAFSEFFLKRPALAAASGAGSGFLLGFGGSLLSRILKKSDAQLDAEIDEAWYDGKKPPAQPDPDGDFDNAFVSAAMEERQQAANAPYEPTQLEADAAWNDGDDGPYGVTRKIEPDHVLIQELRDANIKFSEEDIVFITRDQTNQIVWLETGNSGAGLMHILDGNGKSAGHAAHFEQAFGVPRSQVPAFLKEVVTNGNIVSNELKRVPGGYGFERIYAYKGKRYLLAGIGTNGFIVSAYPI